MHKNENIAIASIQALNFCINIAIWIGENKTHNAGDLLFTIPAEYSPKKEQRVLFTGQAGSVSGIVKIATDGKVTVFLSAILQLLIESRSIVCTLSKGDTMTSFKNSKEKSADTANRRICGAVLLP